jgi:hypothetical protein
LRKDTVRDVKLSSLVEQIFLSPIGDYLESKNLPRSEGLGVQIIFDTHVFKLLVNKSSASEDRRELWYKDHNGTSSKPEALIYGPDQIASDLKKKISDWQRQTEYQKPKDEAIHLGELIADLVEDTLRKTPTLETQLRRIARDSNPVSFYAFCSQNRYFKKLGEQFFVEIVNYAQQLMPEIEIRPNIGYQVDPFEFLTIGCTFGGADFFIGFHSSPLEDQAADYWCVLNSKGKLIPPITPPSLTKHKEFDTISGLPKGLSAQVIARVWVNTLKGLIRNSKSGVKKGNKVKSEPTVTTPKWESEDDILSTPYDDETIFSADRLHESGKHGESTIPDEVLDYYKISDETQLWTAEYVKRSLQGVWVSWDNKESVIRNHSSTAKSSAEKYFDEKFPKFHKVNSRFYRSGNHPGFFSSLFSGEVMEPSFSSRKLEDRKQVFISELAELIESEVQKSVNELVSNSYGDGPKDWEKSVRNLWKPLGPRPLIPPNGLTPKQAETYVSQLLKFYGLLGVKETRFTQDGGIDVSSEKAVFQVKHQVGRVGVQVVREIFGVAASLGKNAGVFAKTGFTREAIEFASTNRVTLFSYVPNLEGHTPLSRRIVQEGFSIYDQ